MREIRLIDDAGGIAAGKALDIRQAGPIGKSDTIVTGSADVLVAASADVIIVADPVNDGEWEGERGLALVERLIRAGCTAPLVFAGPKQTWLMEAAARELHVPADRLIGTAAAAVVNTVAALVHAELGQSGAQVAAVGRPPSFVIGWNAATIAGSLITDRVAAHRLLAISQSLTRLWPPGPQAIAAPTALVVEALSSGSRALLPAAAITEGELGARGVAALLCVEFGRGRILRRAIPTLSPQERTEATNTLLKR